MRSILTLLLLGLATATAQAQDHMDLQRLSAQGQSQAVLEGALERLEQTPDDRVLTHLAGRSLAELGRNEEARPYLERCTAVDTRDWIYAWSLFYLGGIDVSSGDHEAARQKWREVRDGRITENVAKLAANNLRGFALDEAFDDWIKRDSEHLRAQFSPAHADKDIGRWMQGHELAWGRLGELFDGTPDAPVRYIVWGDLAEAKDLCGIQMLGFAKPEYYLVHCRWEQSVGHELAHVFVGQVLHPTVTTRFINEGVAVAHDLTNRDRIEVAREAIRESGLASVDIRSLWVGDHSSADEILYPVSGAWVDFLVEREGREKMLELAQEQTLDHAAVIYGDAFDGLIGEFESLVNE